MLFPRLCVWLAGTLAPLALSAADTVFADFEGPDYGGWVTTGTAFGPGPARGTLPNQQAVSGFRGMGLVNSYLGGDAATGTLTSPEFTVSQRYLNFLVGGGGHDDATCVQVVVDGQPVRSVSGRDDETLSMATFDLGEFTGRKARIRIVDEVGGGWGHINADHFVFSDSAATPPVVRVLPDVSRLYDETWRPQFHFTAQKNWLNDPNGLVWLDGEYHLFFQHNPHGREWGNMTWGHAVSTDLVSWRQLDHALHPDRFGTMFSGSAVVDRRNSAGFGRDALVAMYTAAGGTSPESKGMPFTQCIAFSTDRGRTWTKYAGNPVIPNVGDGDRDPKVFWHGPTRRWVTPLYVGEPVTGPDGKRAVRHRCHFYTSPDLKVWSYASTFREDLYECPGLVELPVEGRRGQSRWLLWGADGGYWLGRFDGREFTPETPRIRMDHGANFYASQAWDDLPDRRVVLIGWMNGGKYPGMPFNQQMGIPTTLSLRQGPDGLRLRRWPLDELARLREPGRSLRLRNAGHDALARAESMTLDAADISIELPPGRSTLLVRGLPIEWDSGTGRLRVRQKEAVVRPAGAGGNLRLRLLLDRTSLETFADDGMAVFSDCFLPPAGDRSLRVQLSSAGAVLPTLEIHPLRSAWPAAP